MNAENVLFLHYTVLHKTCSIYSNNLIEKIIIQKVDFNLTITRHYGFTSTVSHFNNK